jgi:3-(3-hydroxy-phenyl)propionate hydroxylase/flavoprotein hydroxylase
MDVVSLGSSGDISGVPDDHDYDVAVIGYGPTGALLTLMLARAGFRVCAIERHSSLFGLPRAVHFDDEIARILQSAGLEDAIARFAVPTERCRFDYIGAAGQTIMSMDVGTQVGDAGWATAYSFAQPDLECALDEAVSAQPTATVMMGTACNDVHQDADGATLTVEPRDGSPSRQVRARYVVGADGANSFVRTRMNVEVRDLGFAYDWLVVSIRYISPNAPKINMTQICDPARPITIVPGGHDRQRFEFMLTPDENAADMNAPDIAWALLAPFGVTPDNAVLERHAVYTFGARWAESWRDGRLFLAGDAAHIMPPFRAQGMCSGMRDAATLAWRLAMVLRGDTSDALLDGYAEERLPHVIAMIEQTIEIGRMICIADPVRAAQRDAMMEAAAKMPDFKPPIQPIRLGNGLVRENDPTAGFLGFQGRVELNGHSGRFDTVVGGGFSLVAVGVGPNDHLTEESRAYLDELGAIVAQVSGDGLIRDVDRQYEAWFAREGIVAILLRPDFYRFGSAVSAADIEPLVASLRAKLPLRVPVAA